MRRISITLLLALYIGIGIWYALSVPAGEGVDIFGITAQPVTLDGVPAGETVILGQFEVGE